MNEECIISISHSNYLKKNAGTEKCMREIKKLLANNKIHYLQIFSFEKYSKLYKLSDMSNKIGINYDDKFLGIFSYNSLLGLIKKIEVQKNVKFIGIHINNVINHDLKLLKNFLMTIRLPIVVWLHDYSAICEDSPVLLKEPGESCNNFTKDKKICCKCKKYRKENKIYQFYKIIDERVDSVIAPSESVKNNILLRYNFWKNKIYIRSHLKLRKLKKRDKLSDPIKIAFIGGKYLHNGYREWKILLENFKNNPMYKFFYLGSSDIKDEKEINNIFVDVSLQGENAMKNAVRYNNIDVAFLWSKCQETYSYTYFEALCGGARIITYVNAGNIADRVRVEKSGIVFENIQELIYLMRNSTKFRDTLENLEDLYYSDYDINNSLDYIVPKGNCDISRIMTKKERCYMFLTVIYMMSNWIKRLRDKK